MSDGVDLEWLHALRNAVNATIASLAVVRRALDSGDITVAATFIAHAETAGERCRQLLLSDIATQTCLEKQNEPSE
jgi:hypothetical protein